MHSRQLPGRPRHRIRHRGSTGMRVARTPHFVWYACSPLDRVLIRAANRIGPDGAQDVAACVAGQPSLSTLDLAGNNMGDRGLESILYALQRTPNVQQLGLEANHIADSGAIALAMSLESLPRLEHLNLSSLLIFKYFDVAELQRKRYWSSRRSCRCVVRGAVREPQHH